MRLPALQYFTYQKCLVIIWGDLGWRKVEERREEKKVLYGRRLQRLDDNRLVKQITAKKKECGGVSWEGECELLLRKYKLEDYEMGSVQKWKERVHSINSRDWLEEVEGKSSLSW